MIPTDEQKAILNATGRVVLINARAGTGKSTTLRMVSELYADRRIVYLVFNKRAEVEAKRTFPTHVESRTVHALAFRNQMRVYRHRPELSRTHGLVVLTESKDRC